MNLLLCGTFSFDIYLPCDIGLSNLPLEKLPPPLRFRPRLAERPPEILGPFDEVGKVERKRLQKARNK